MNNKLPIGYYLKKADNLLTEGINSIHNEFGIKRLDWQILNTINEDVEMDRQKLSETLLEFATQDQINSTVDILSEKQFIKDEKFLSLAEKGKTIYQKCVARQKEFRQKAMRNITESEYIQMTTTLEKMIKNLEG